MDIRLTHPHRKETTQVTQELTEQTSLPRPSHDPRKSPPLPAPPARILVYKPGDYLIGILPGLLRDTPVTHTKGVTYPSCRQRSLSSWQRS